MNATPPLGLAVRPQPMDAGAGMTWLPGKPFSHLAAVAAAQWVSCMATRCPRKRAALITFLFKMAARV